MANAVDFEVAVRRALINKKSLIVDLRQCMYFDSCGLKVLVRCGRDSELRVLTRRGSTIERVFELTRIPHVSHEERELAALL